MGHVTPSVLPGMASALTCAVQRLGWVGDLLTEGPGAPDTSQKLQFEDGLLARLLCKWDQSIETRGTEIRLGTLTVSEKIARAGCRQTGWGLLLRAG